MTKLTSRSAGLIVAVIGSLITLTPAFSQEYFKGKTITMYSGYVGGGVDNEMRLAARFLGKYIPGHPHITPSDMPGANGVVLADWLYKIAKPDGLSLALPGRGGYILAAMIREKGVKYDMTKFNFLGSSGIANDILWLRKGLGIRSVAQLLKVKKPIVMGGIGATTPTVIIPTILAKFKTLPLRVVPGYPGTNQTVVALEGGEIDGLVNQAPNLPPDVITSGKIVPIVQSLPIRPHLPTFTSLIKNEREKAVMHMVLTADSVGAPLIAPPGVPDHLMKILRNAYTAMVKSPEYRAAASKERINVSKPYLGKALQKFVVNNMKSVSPATIKAYYSVVGAK